MHARPILLLLAAAAALTAQEAPPIAGPEIWFHIMTNLNNDQSNEKLFALMERAARSGYTGVSIFDSRFMLRRLQDDAYRAKVARFRAKADELHLKIAACFAAVGYAEEMLDNDHSLHEAMPVRKAPFVVRDGALVADDPDTAIVDGGFEDVGPRGPKGWDVDDFGTVATIDEQDAPEGKRCLRIRDPDKAPDGHARAIQRLKVHPWRAYHVSAMMKTQDNASSDMRIMAMGEYPLDWTPLPLEKTMGWKRVDVVFNSLDREEVGLYIGTWGPRAGTYWLDDVRIEPAGFDNVVRRDDLPLTITSEDGATTYVEGKDFDRVVDPGLTGGVSPWHQQPRIGIPAGSALKEGQRVLASYHHAMTGMTPNNSAICPSAPGTYVEIETEARFLAQHLRPEIYFFQHDEMRQLGWDDSCAKRGLTSGQILADHIAKCVAIVEQVDPGKPMVVWNDDFDPYHNAKKPGSEAYYLVKGPGAFWESWKGLPKRVGVVNWANGNADSVKFFADEGHPQILSWDNPEAMKGWLEKTKDSRGVSGVIYTTWSDDWSRLEAYGAMATAWFKDHPPAK